MVLNCGEMRQAEEVAFARGITAGQLMEEAGAGIAGAVTQFFPRPGLAVLYLGKGNNAGDALVAARHLLDAGWHVAARLAFGTDQFSALPAGHWKMLGEKIERLDSGDEISRREGVVVLVDGLVGIGATGPLRDKLADLAEEMNRLRRMRHAVTVALDIPSGLDPESGAPGASCVRADLTLTIAYVKNALLADAATDLVGRLAVVPLRELSGAKGDTSRRLAGARQLLETLPRRPFEFHKGQAGRVGIIAGSRGFLGAASLCATAALRGGAGLVTLFVRHDVYPLVAALTPPEVMVREVGDYREALEAGMDAIGLGPGLGLERGDEILDVIVRAAVPLVLDADALNLLAQRGLDALRKNSTPRLLTPHPGEMARLAAREPALHAPSRAAQAEAFAAMFPQAALLLKGARTVVAAKDRPLSFNSTGHPGMATGGMGDVLTGLCTALVAQGVAVFDAACLGAWLCGRAAEIAVRDGAESQESLVAGDVTSQLGAACGDLRRLVY